MADVQYWQDLLNQEIESIRDLLDTIPRKSSMEKSHLIDQADKKIRDAQGTKRSFKMECRLVSDPNERRRYESQLSDQEKILTEISRELMDLRRDTPKGELFMGADMGGDGTTGELDGEKAGDALLKDASRIQDKTKASIDNIARMTAEAKNVGMETMEELRRQRDQISAIDEEAMKIEDNLKRADKLIRTFGRRMATDKLIQCFACLNVLLLVGVIVFSIVKKGGIPGDGLGEKDGPVQPVRMLRGNYDAIQHGNYHPVDAYLSSNIPNTRTDYLSDV